MEGVEVLALVVGEPSDALLVQIGEQRVADGMRGVGTDRHQDVSQFHQRRYLVLLVLAIGFEIVVPLAFPESAVEILQPDGALLVADNLGHLLDVVHFAVLLAAVVVDTVNLAAVESVIAVGEQRQRVTRRQLCDAMVGTDAVDAARRRCQQRTALMDQLPAGMADSRDGLENLVAQLEQSAQRAGVDDAAEPLDGQYLSA